MSGALPKIISVFYACEESTTDHAELHRSTYIVPDARTVKLSTILGDLRAVFRLAPLASGAAPSMMLVDMNGARVRSAADLYAMSPTTFLLTTQTGRDAALRCFAKLVQPRGSSANGKSSSTGARPSSVWATGTARLMMPVEHPVDKPSPIDAIQLERAKRRRVRTGVPRVATMQTSAQRQRIKDIQENKAASGATAGAKKKSKTRRKKKKRVVVEEVDGETPDVEVPAKTEEKPPPTAMSQIEAQKLRVQSCQEHMAGGESFLDKMGRQDAPTARRFRRSPIDAENTPKLKSADDMFASISPTHSPPGGRLHGEDDVVRVRSPIDETNVGEALWAVSIDEDDLVEETPPRTTAIRPNTVTLTHDGRRMKNLPVASI